MSEPAAWADETEARLLEAMIEHAPRQGWSLLAIESAARDVGLSRAEAELLVPHGPRDLAALLARHHDALALARLAHIDPQSLKIRERIRQGVLARCDVAFQDEPATRRWMGFLILPLNIPLALRLAWASADAIWRLAGDTATDLNHYSKRAILGAVYAATLAVYADDKSEGKIESRAFLDRRIDDVMRFEKAKAGWRRAGSDYFSPARFVGRLRYPAR